MRVLLVGADQRFILFWERIHAVSGLEIMGVGDDQGDPACRKLAKILGVPLLSGLGGLKGASPDLIVNMLNRPCPSIFSVSNVPVIQSAALDFMNLVIQGLPGEALADDGECSGPTIGQAGLGEGMIIGKSPRIREALDLLAQVASTPSTVLLLGETGTGKDLAARYIHQSSHLRKRAFVPVNCTALTPSLMESELFGYVRGAFTGAERDRKGLLEEADGGTLFLDEIGDMRIELQAKLLRFLQTGEARRVGSTQTRTLNVRIIAATNRDLEQAVEQGEFRRDLYYRFNAFTVVLPPLRERVVDIPYLAYHFLTRAEARLNKRVEGFSDPALYALSGYAWPGNVRELKNIVERAVILCRAKNIDLEHLPDQLRADIRECAPGEPLREPRDEFGPTLLARDRERVVANFEKKELQNYLKKANGNVSEASRLSGVPRRTFYRKMRKYGL